MRGRGKPDYLEEAALNQTQKKPRSLIQLLSSEENYQIVRLSCGNREGWGYGIVV